MAPFRTIKRSNPARSNSSTSPPLRQGNLAFPSTKRSHSNPSVTKAKGKRPSASKPQNAAPAVTDDSSDIELIEAPQTPVRSSIAAEKGKGIEGGEVFEILDLDDKKGRWNKHYGVVREKMGNLTPIHAKGQKKVHHILRVFDLSDEYGPCIGVTRLERWERAEALGLNPPQEVKEILETKQGMEEDEFKQCVLFGEV